MDDETEIEVIKTIDYPSIADLDERRRAFVLEMMVAHVEAVDGKKFVLNMQYVSEWLRDGIVPPVETKRPKLTAVE